MCIRDSPAAMRAQGLSDHAVVGSALKPRRGLAPRAQAMHPEMFKHLRCAAVVGSATTAGDHDR
eukprot:1467527-Pyramimonas_sp.AAC.1